MRLRERQIVAVDKSDAALIEHGNTLLVAPTGAGKTVMLSSIARRGALAGSEVFLQHRDELVAQNRTTFELVNPGVTTGLFTADRKEWGYGAVFAMVPTLARNLAWIDNSAPVATIKVDEAHHCAADSYRKIIDALMRRNPNAKLLGATATPNRGDKKALRGVFSNCADQITLGELIKTKFLVPPRTFVIDVGVRDQLSKVRKTMADFDMDAVAEIMDTKPINAAVVKHWKERAGDRQTVAFCSNVAAAHHLAEEFGSNGVKVCVVHGEMGEADRRKTLAAYDRREFQVVVNVMVLTEGWDNQPTSCVLLLRPSSYKSTMMQMVGRGLRKVEPERYPGIRKDDCIVMDFGTSILTHGSIEQDVNLEGKGTKECPSCAAIVPSQVKDCPICGFEFPVEEDPEMKQCGECGADNFMNARVCTSCGAPFGERSEKSEISDFIMTELDLLNQSPFKWEEIFDGLVLVADAFSAWAMCVAYNGRWFALGGDKPTGVHLLGDTADRMLALVSADDFLRQRGDKDAANKSKRWLHEGASMKQLQLLGFNGIGNPAGLSKYQASCHLTWKFNERQVRAKLEMTRQIAA